ncbi:hypothetical protein F4680DRAFT_467381 [Xylaria scruposa]|nr:hypothetical protein F4680DRAFT_467381 [Xylaria scruposa]
MAHAEPVESATPRMRLMERNRWTSGHGVFDESNANQLMTQADFRTILCQLRSDLIKNAIPALHPRCEACRSLPDSATADRRLISVISDCIDDAVGKWIFEPEANSSAPEASSRGFSRPSIEQDMYDDNNSQAQGVDAAPANSSGTRVERSNVSEDLQAIFANLNRGLDTKPPTSPSPNLTFPGLRTVLSENSPNSEGEEITNRLQPPAPRLDWEAHKTIIRHLYIEKNFTLTAVQQRMAEEYGFMAT